MKNNVTLNVTYEVTLRNPSQTLIESSVTEPLYKWVRTCRSSTCSCSYHDSGYLECILTLPEDTLVELHGGNAERYATTSLSVGRDRKITPWGDLETAPLREWKATAEGQWIEYGKGLLALARLALGDEAPPTPTPLEQLEQIIDLRCWIRSSPQTEENISFAAVSPDISTYVEKCKEAASAALAVLEKLEGISRPFPGH